MSSGGYARAGVMVGTVVLVAACSSVAPTSTQGGSIPQPEVTGLPVAERADRVDLAVPSFTDPTSITNPLFPIEPEGSAVLLGTVDDQPFRAEVTVLPDTQLITWGDRRIETVVSQYVAYLGGQLHEVALDHYAQDDSGNVWYFGEDVYNYDSGVAADTEGTWFAGRDGPAAMIMPAEPRVGTVYRPENIPELVFEEVTVEATDAVVTGPRGEIEGALRVVELHMDGATEAKTFAPGYGEFYTDADGDVEALAIASPTDFAPGTEPTVFAPLLAGSDQAILATIDVNWAAASAALDQLTAAWHTYSAGPTPPLLSDPVATALDRLGSTISNADEPDAARAALDLRRAILDLALLYYEPVDVDLARLAVWADQLTLDIEYGSAADVMGDLVSIDWTRNRFAHAIPSIEVSELDAALGPLRAAAIAATATDAANASPAVRLTVAQAMSSAAQALAPAAH